MHGVTDIAHALSPPRRRALNVEMAVNPGADRAKILACIRDQGRRAAFAAWKVKSIRVITTASTRNILAAVNAVNREQTMVGTIDRAICDACVVRVQGMSR